MNFINCTGNVNVELLRKTVVFWSENSFQHIATLLKITNGTTAVLQPFFKEKLQYFENLFKKIHCDFKEKNMPNANYANFLKINREFINLLERLKYEGFGGYPIIQQTVFHFIYEQRYINAVFGAKNFAGNILITQQFSPFFNHTLNCFYNQMYFWSIIGAMHPSLLMENNAFYNAINGYSKEFLTEITNNFNAVNFKLSELKKPVKKSALKEIFKEFCILNKNFTDFLISVKQNSLKIFTSPFIIKFPASFYTAVEHQLNEHRLAEEISGNIKKYL